MDRLAGDLWALFSKAIQTLAQQDAGSYCFHPLHSPRPSLSYLRKLLIELPNLACPAACASIHLGNPGSIDNPQIANLMWCFRGRMALLAISKQHHSGRAPQ
jgi:hypothetical protein